MVSFSPLYSRGPKTVPRRAEAMGGEDVAQFAGAAVKGRA